MTDTAAEIPKRPTATLQRAPSLSELVSTLRAKDPSKWNQLQLSKLDTTTTSLGSPDLGDSPSRLRLPSLILTKGSPVAPPLERSHSSPLICRGKTIPTLDEIQSRFAKKPSSSSMERSNSEGAVPKIHVPPPEQVLEATEGEKDASPSDASSEHPLEHEWTIYYDSKTSKSQLCTPVPSPIPSVKDAPKSPGKPKIDEDVYEAALQRVGSFRTVQSFCRYWNWTKRPSALVMHANLHLFKDGIKPMWEDESNKNGGKWTLTFKHRDLSVVDQAWQWIGLALIGEDLDPEDAVCGAVLATRPRGYRIQIWTRETEDIAAINALGKRLVKVLELDDTGSDPCLSLDFTPHTHNHRDSASAKYISITPIKGFKDSPLSTPSLAPPSALGTPRVKSPLTPQKEGAGNVQPLGFSAFADNIKGLGSPGRPGMLRSNSDRTLSWRSG